MTKLSQRLVIRLFTASLALSVTACVTPGDIAKHIDPQEGRLVQLLIQESCTVNMSYNPNAANIKPVKADTIAVLDIQDTGIDDGRIATIAFQGFDRKFGFNTRTALIRCGDPIERFYAEKIPFVRYHKAPSKILVERGGDPSQHKEGRAITTREPLIKPKNF